MAKEEQQQLFDDHSVLSNMDLLGQLDNKIWLETLQEMIDVLTLWNA